MNFRCDYIVDCKGQPKPFPIEKQEQVIKTVIEPMAGDGLRTICIAYKDYIRGEAEYIVQGLTRPGKLLEFDLSPGKLLEFAKSKIYPGIVMEKRKILLEKYDAVLEN